MRGATASLAVRLSSKTATLCVPILCFCSLSSDLIDADHISEDALKRMCEGNTELKAVGDE